jgi:protease PrsW
MGFLLSLFFGFAPMLLFAYLIYWLDRYEREPVVLLGMVFTWGAVVAAGAAFIINTSLGIGIYLFTNSEAASNLTTGSLIAPLVEETLKGIAVLIIFLVFHREFDSILDGIVYAGIVALGFAATENIYYIYTYGYQESGYSGLLWMIFVRVILVGWQHPFYTAFTGIGLAIARMSRQTLVKLFSPLIGWSAAVFTHSFHNTLSSLLKGGTGFVLSTGVDWSGWLIMLAFIILMLHREQRWLKTQLKEEVSRGVISPGQYQIACSSRLQSKARFGALFTGSYTATDRFYKNCGELAYKKQQRSKMGEEDGNTPIIERLRSELGKLSPRV